MDNGRELWWVGMGDGWMVVLWAGAGLETNLREHCPAFKGRHHAWQVRGLAHTPAAGPGLGLFVASRLLPLGGDPVMGKHTPLALGLGLTPGEASSLKMSSTGRRHGMA